jgi:hypothetical protein
MNTPTRIPALILAAALCASPALAQPLTREELQQALSDRDRQITALEQRIDALERERSAGPAAAVAPPAAIPPASAAPASGPAPAGQAARDDDEAELQALSRTLVQRGVLLLPAWSVEAVPSFAYANREVQGLALAQTPEGVPTVADQRLREDQLRGALTLRAGLPWSSQIDVTVPYVWIRQARSLGDGTQTSNDGSGLGDVQLAVSHQFLREAGWRPDLIAGLSWRAPTGRDPNRVAIPALASGFGTHEFGVRLTGLKSSDPLVFVGTLSYAHDLSVSESFGTYQPGDALGIELGSVLALNPETSLTLGLSQQFRGRVLLNRQSLPGTDTVESSLLLGFDRVLTPRLLLDLSLGVGLTRDAPDYVLQLSLPYRFR